MNSVQISLERYCTVLIGMTLEDPSKDSLASPGGCICQCTYGGHKVSPKPFPPLMKDLRSEVIPFCGIVNPSQFLTSCNVNLYENGNSGATWHADDGGLFRHTSPEVRIISPSLGQERSFEICPSHPDGGRVRLFFCICTMEGRIKEYYRFESTSHGAGL